MSVEYASEGLAKLAKLVDGLAQTSGDHPTSIPGLTLHRRNSPTEPLACIYSLSLSLVVQGEKTLFLNEQVSHYHPGHTMLTSLDLPVVAHISRASRQQPFLAVLLQLDSSEIMAVNAQLDLPRPGRDWQYQPLSIEAADNGLQDALYRLVQLLATPTLRAPLLPLIKQEILIRLLTGPHGPHLRYLVAAGSHNEQIAKVIAWLKQNFTRPLGMDELAQRAHMSASTFRAHFRAITGTSPLQYLKLLRLQEARDLMLSKEFDASYTSALVGYDSPSQFSREYRRQFGLPPQQDIHRLRLQGQN
ncbi:AraC family transcriptional regulator [Bowmanella pacifica]|uniref:AraC family transcriptional regulator n=1 Tax=Bowmanella pacifica TaxID=502051 RepID=A0A917YXV6_9ALTE|nr:AraC family transcriptional regulator [Bowmanella pacifica]GGO67761.1 AraC family transcriptional regulator [Bowmanella pacifica]